MNKFQMFVNTAKFTAKKFAPEILLGVGIIGASVGTVLACRATLRIESILDDYQETKEQIEYGIALDQAGERNYPAEIADKDMNMLKVRTTVDMVALYGPSVTLILVSFGCILGAHHIMTKRQVALMAAYKLVEESFMTYRGRVIKELGAAKDAHFMYGTETVGVDGTFVDADGNEQQVVTKHEELVPGAKLSGFARRFEPEQPDQYGGWSGSTQFCKVHDYNVNFLDQKENYFNAKLTAKGFVTVNEVYDELGFNPTEAGMICGWRYKSEQGDGRISFRPRGIDGNWVMGDDGDSIILDFNIDGVIFDQEYARKELK